MKRLILFLALMLAAPAAFAGPLVMGQVVSGAFNNGDYVYVDSVEQTTDGGCITCAGPAWLWTITERSPFFDPCAPNLSVNWTAITCTQAAVGSVWEVGDIEGSCRSFYPSCGEP